MFIPADAEHDITIKHYATKERIEEILANREEHLSQFKYDLSPKEILSIASENYYAGINYAFNQLKQLLDTSLEDYENISKTIYPIIDKIQNEALKKHTNSSVGGKSGAEITNYEHKKLWMTYQVMINKIYSDNKTNNSTYSHTAACKKVAEQLRKDKITVRGKPVSWHTILERTTNPKTKKKKSKKK